MVEHISGIRRINLLTGENAFQLRVNTLQGLHLRDNTTISVVVGEMKTGKASVGLALKKGKSTTGSVGLTFYFREDVNLADLPVMALSTDIIVAALAIRKMGFGMADVCKSIFAAVVSSFGTLTVTATRVPSPGKDQITLSVEVGELHLSLTDDFFHLADYFELDEARG
jgi:hypothetical protein